MLLIVSSFVILEEEHTALKALTVHLVLNVWTKEQVPMSGCLTIVAYSVASGKRKEEIIPRVIVLLYLAHIYYRVCFFICSILWIGDFGHRISIVARIGIAHFANEIYVLRYVIFIIIGIIST